MEPVKLLIADDHPVFREGLAIGLNSWPEIDLVAQAGDGTEAVAMIEEHHPQVALVDMRMPGLSGLDVVRALREKESDVAVVMLTAEQDPQIVYQSIAEGARGFLPKDMDRDSIARAVLSVARGGVALPPDAQSSLFTQVQTRADADRVNLSDREAEVLAMIASGHSAPAIAKELHLATATVKTHLQSLYEKLGVNDRAAAVASAMRRGLLR